jgi:hypothetical protein
LPTLEILINGDGFPVAILAYGGGGNIIVECVMIMTTDCISSDLRVFIISRTQSMA